VGRTRGGGTAIGGLALWLAVACNGGSSAREGADAAPGDDAAADAAGIDATHALDPWSLQLIGPWGEEIQFAVAADDSSVVIGGEINESAVLGGKSMMADGLGDAFFVARVAADGDVMWAQAFGGNDTIILGDLAVSPAGDAYVTGRFRGTIDLGGPEPAVAVGDTFDFFVAKYAATDGAPVWAKDFGGPASDAGTALDVTADGDVVVAGYLAGYVQLGGDFLESSDGRDVFLARYGAEDGAHRWSRILEGPGAEEVTSLDVLGGGTMLAGGLLWTESGVTRVAWLDADGDATGASELGTGLLHVWAAVPADGDDAIVAGTFQGAVAIGDQDASSSDVGSFFARVAGADRSVTWATFAGDEGATLVTDMALGGDGRVLGAGFLLGRATFGGDTLDSGDGQAAIFLELDGATGEPGGGATYGDNQARGNAVTARPDGGIVFCGGFREDIDLGTGVLATETTGDGFAALLPP